MTDSLADLDRRLAVLREGTRALRAAAAREIAERAAEVGAERRRADGDAFYVTAVRGTILDPAVSGTEDAEEFAAIMRNPAIALDKANAL